MNYILKISAGKVFRSNLRNVFLLSEKKAVNYNFHFLYICLETCTSSSWENLEVLLIFVIDLLNKDLSLLIEPPPFNLEREHMHLLLDIFTF